MRSADLVTSDVVGIVRLGRPAPVEGQELDGDRELGFVETLGIRNPVRSRGPGRLSAVLVTDGQPVEYGQPLFAIER
ncbi:MAG TPA: biotin/lipoyl-binding protein [Candidatus Elarobacter sp.]